MSMPNIPDINPDICLCLDDVINLLLSSVALQEIAISNVINAESEKLQYILKKKNKCYSVNELVCLNESIERVLNEVSSIETLLVSKLKYINQLYDKHHKHKDCNECDDCCDEDDKCDFSEICNKYIGNFNCKPKHHDCEPKCENEYICKCECECECECIPKCDSNIKCENECDDKSDYDLDIKYKENDKPQIHEIPNININENNKSANYINEHYNNLNNGFENVINNINNMNNMNSNSNMNMSMNNNYMNSKNPYYQNYNKIAEMFNKILGRSSNKMM